MSKEVGEMVRSRDVVQAEGSARTEGARRATLYLEPAGMSQAELSRRLNMPTNRINELIRGKRGMTPSTALGLAEVFDNTPQFWMNLQTNAELWEAEQKKLAYA